MRKGGTFTDIGIIEIIEIVIIIAVIAIIGIGISNADMSAFASQSAKKNAKEFISNVEKPCKYSTGVITKRITYSFYSGIKRIEMAGGSYHTEVSGSPDFDMPVTACSDVYICQSGTGGLGCTKGGIIPGGTVRLKIEYNTNTQTAAIAIEDAYSSN